MLKGSRVKQSEAEPSYKVAESSQVQSEVEPWQNVVELCMLGEVEPYRTAFYYDSTSLYITPGPQTYVTILDSTAFQHGSTLVYMTLHDSTMALLHST